jgi:enoyl-CoA hydratase/3-hydroxyacyl-CoA dehydrogenase
MKNPERIVGAHFFSPAHVMQLFEIIRTDATPPQVLLDTLSLSKQIKKTPVVVGNCTGFAVNRVFFPYTMSACLLLDLGCDPKPYHPKFQTLNPKPETLNHKP